MKRRLTISLLSAAVLAGCVSLEPRTRLPEPPVQAEWPIPPTTATASEPATLPVAALESSGLDAPAGAAPDIGWRDFFADENLERLIELSLRNNRDLRVAVANIESARAEYRIRRADRVPSIDGTAVMARGSELDGPVREQFTADLRSTAFEVDLFGRVRSLQHAALERYAAQEEARRATQLSLIAEVASVYLTLAADRELHRLALSTLENQEASFRMTEERHRLGGASGLELRQAKTTVESARADVALYAGLIAQDINALTLLVGTTVDPALLPESFDFEITGLAALPAGLPSEVLLRRPDVRQAEHALRAANAMIGAARAAFFPSVTLTGSAGTASDDLSDLFTPGSHGWSFLPQLNLPIFQGGRLLAGLDSARAEREAAVARYEQAIQIGFREVADALALTETRAAQRQAQESLVVAAREAYELSEARYRAGLDSFFITLDAQRTYYAAQRSLIATQLAEQANRVTLYKVLGGGWKE